MSRRSHVQLRFPCREPQPVLRDGPFPTRSPQRSPSPKQLPLRPGSPTGGAWTLTFRLAHIAGDNALPSADPRGATSRPSRWHIDLSFVRIIECRLTAIRDSVELTYRKTGDV